MPHTGLGNALVDKGRLDDAVSEFRTAIDLDPRDARPLGALGRALALQGRFAEAREANRGCLALLPPGHPLRQHALQQLEQCEHGLALESKLGAILAGKAKPADASERVGLAQLCQQPCKSLYATAAHFYADAIAEQPKLADDLRSQFRYNAACAATLAGCGHGKDADQTDEGKRTRLRQQALEWLHADLAAYRGLLDREPDKAAPLVRERMQHWQQDKDFAGLRGEAALAQLAEAERRSWQQLWADVAATLARAQKQPAAEKKSDTK